jgi:hypothetical protein
MRLFVRYGKGGEIISAMKVETMDESLEHPYGWVDEGEEVIEVRPPKGAEAMDCDEIGQSYKVDLAKKNLKKAAAKKPAAKKSTAARTTAEATGTGTRKPSRKSKKPRRGSRD